VFIHEYYFATKSFPAVCEAFCCVHPSKRFLRRQYCSGSWKNLRKWSVWDGKHVRPVTVLTHDMVNTVEETLTQSPCRSSRRLSRDKL
jgi:hypothetical protein